MSHLTFTMEDFHERLGRSNPSDLVLDERSKEEFTASYVPEARSWQRSLMVGIAAGTAATFITGGSDRTLGRCVSKEQKYREQRIREGSAHEIAGPLIAERVVGQELSQRQKKMAKLVFSVVYGVLWGTIYAALRRKLPTIAEPKGLPIGAAVFFLACDGIIAPVLKFSPSLPRIPWQFNAKEFANHLVWLITAEMIHRGDEHFAERGRSI